MNKSEKLLLKEMKEPSRETELLSSIKKSVDPLGQLHGDFKFKAEISLNISVAYQQAGVGIIAPAALPGILQTRIPLYLLGLTDFLGSFAKSQIIIHPIAPWILNQFFIVPVPWGMGLFAIYPNIHSGDLYIDYEANVGGVIYHCHVFVNCENVSYGTFLNSFVSDLIILNQIQYSVPVIQNYQLINPLIFSYQSLFGKLASESLDPRMYVTNQTFNQYIANIPITLAIDKSLMLNTYITFDVQNLNFLLTVQKVKPLTFH